MKAPASFSRPEPLEARIAPATLDFAAGVVTYTAGAGVNNAFILSISGANYSFADAGEPITLTQAAIDAGFTGGGGAAALGPNAAITSIVVNLGDQNDQCAIQALDDPLTVDTQAGTADSIFVTGAGTVNVRGALSLAAETITVSNAITGATAATFMADSMSFTAAVAASERAILQTATVSRDVNLGTETAGQLSLTDAELDFITTPGDLVISAGASPLTVSAAITPANVDVLRLAVSGISGGGSIAIETLDIAVKGTIALAGANDVDILLLSSGSAPSTMTFSDADGFTLGRAGRQTNLPDFTVVTLTAGGTGVVIDPATQLLLGLSGSGPGVGHDQIIVNGSVTIAGVGLSPGSGFNLPLGTEFVLISNDGSDPIVGTFAGLPEGVTIPSFSTPATITYMGGDGNDVAIVTVAGLEVTLSNGGKTATYRDVDGDIVTVKSSRTAFDGTEFRGIETGPNGAGLLQRLTLDADFTGTNLTITARPSADGGNGFVNVGRIDATGVDLGAVRIAGDLGRLVAGTVGGDARVPGLKSLTVQSLGLLGTSTQSEANATTGVRVEGALPRLTVAGDLRAAVNAAGAADGILGRAIIGGSVVNAGDLCGCGDWLDQDRRRRSCPQRLDRHPIRWSHRHHHHRRQHGRFVLVQQHEHPRQRPAPRTDPGCGRGAQEPQRPWQRRV